MNIPFHHANCTNAALHWYTFCLSTWALRAAQVTETDQQCEALVFEALRGAFPAHSFIGAPGSLPAGPTGTHLHTTSQQLRVALGHKKHSLKPL